MLVGESFVTFGRQLTGENGGAVFLQNSGKFPVTQCDITEDTNLHRSSCFLSICLLVLQVFALPLKIQYVSLISLFLCTCHLTVCLLEGA